MKQILMKYHRHMAVLSVIAALFFVFLPNFADKPMEDLNSFGTMFSWLFGIIFLALTGGGTLVYLLCLLLALWGYLNSDGKTYKYEHLKEDYEFIPETMSEWENEIVGYGFRFLGSYEGIHRKNVNQNYKSWVYLDESQTIYAELQMYNNSQRLVAFVTDYPDKFSCETYFNLQFEADAKLIHARSFENSLASAYDYHASIQDNFMKQHGQAKSIKLLTDTIHSVGDKRSKGRSIGLGYMWNYGKNFILWLACSVALLFILLQIPIIGGHRILIVFLLLIAAFCWYIYDIIALLESREERKPRKANS